MKRSDRHPVAPSPEASISRRNNGHSTALAESPAADLSVILACLQTMRREIFRCGFRVPGLDWREKSPTPLTTSSR